MVDNCKGICESILQDNPNNEAASVMMADLSFRQMHFESAAYHFSQLLLAQPTYWTALARLIEVMRRSANITECEPFIQSAEQASVQPQYEAGIITVFLCSLLGLYYKTLVFLRSELLQGAV